MHDHDQGHLPSDGTFHINLGYSCKLLLAYISQRCYHLCLTYTHSQLTYYVALENPLKLFHG